MSKGSSRRPAAVPRETVAANYERTFGPTVNPTITEPGTYHAVIERRDPDSGAWLPTMDSVAFRVTPSGPTDAEA